MKKLIIAAFAALFTIAFSGAFATGAVKAYDVQAAASDTNEEQGTHPMDSDKQNATDEDKQDEDKQDSEKKSD